MERHDLQGTLNDIRASITRHIGTLLECDETDFGIDDVNPYRNLLGGGNAYRNLLESLVVSRDYADELIYQIDQGAPDQR